MGDLPNFSPEALPCCHSKLLSCSLNPPNERSWESPAFLPEMSFFVVDSLFSQSERIIAKNRFLISPVPLNPLSVGGKTDASTPKRCHCPHTAFLHLVITGPSLLSSTRACAHALQVIPACPRLQRISYLLLLSQYFQSSLSLLSPAC